jgi:TolB-like protein/lipoprotein NlpI
MALVFYKSPEEPAQCASEISRALKSNPRLQIRMGVHSGPVSAVVDVSERTNVAGAGINMAQRVMDCGDAGHILVSKHVAEDLEQHDRWRPLLHDLGSCEVKHGVRLDVSNLYSHDVGNPQLPIKFQALKKHRSQVRWLQAAIGLLVLGAIVAGFLIVSRKPATSLTAIPEKSIAVLPFANMSDDKANDYFSDGISEELLNLLAKIPQLKVTARVSSFSFKGKELDIPEIARRLGVAHVLEGSVRKAGDQVRITAQLIHAADGFHMWSETYDRKVDDIFKIQDEVAGKVVKELKLSLLEPPPKARTTDPKAYALYLQAKELARHMNAAAFEQSDAFYHQVLEIDPRYAPAWNGLAGNLVDKADDGIVSSAEGYARAREAAEKALAIDPDYAPTHARLGRIAMFENDFAGAANHFERALTLDPTDLDVLQDAAFFLFDLGRMDEAVALQQAVVRRDPVNTTSLHYLGVYQRYSGRYDEAIAAFRTALSLNPGRGAVHFALGVALMLRGDAAGALAEVEQETDEGWRMTGLPMAYHALGRKSDSDTALAALIAKHETDSSCDIAYVYAFRGEADQAFAWLDKAVAYHDPGLGEIVPQNLFDKIHSDPRWLPFVRKIGKAPDQLAKIKFKMTLPPQ